LVTALHQKLARDLWRLRFQALTIAVLVSCGIASFVAAVAVAASMMASKDAFYSDARLADVFVHLKRAPRAVLDRMSELPNVTAVDGRVVSDFRVEIAGTTEPVSARFVSLAPPREQPLNQVRILTGRAPEPGRSDELVVSAAFAEAWSLTPGSSLTAVVNERRAVFRIVGVGVSPEYASVGSPRTGLPDPRHFGVVWMDGAALEKATSFVGAFNEGSLSLAAGADEQETLRSVDRLLEPYGGLGAVARADQPSAKLVGQKIGQLGKLARTLPVVFLGVAAFLLHVLLARIVGTQREQIATLKALGYRTRELSRHYLELAFVICACGILAGIGLGLWSAHGLLHVYARFFKFPVFFFVLPSWPLLAAALIAMAAGLGGAMLAVHRAVSVPPAEAMRPEAPPNFRRTTLDDLYGALSPIARMVLREVQRKPIRLLLSAGSIALAITVVLAGGVFRGSIEEVLRLEFEVSHRERITVTLDGLRPWRAVWEIAHLPGVTLAEGQRIVPVRLRRGSRYRTTSVMSVERAMDLYRLLGIGERPIAAPAEGLAVSRVLAESLGIHAGDKVDVEVLEGTRQVRRVMVGTLVDDLLGMSAYMQATALSDLLGEEPSVDVVLVAAETADIDAITYRLNRMPAVASVSRPDLDRGLVQSEVASELTVLSALLAFFAMAIAVGVVYNNARIALETRSRDLATMRILGFTRGELASLLLSEQAIQVVLGVVPGLWLGRSIGGLWLSTVDRELLRAPLAIEPTAYVLAICVVGLAALLSALLVRRQSDRLDLVAVLKARD
jgi:putative ABC transport system permease protein